MNSTFDSVVVGAGIVGAACALALARNGMRVAIAEMAGTGLGATAAGMGHIVIMDDSPAQFRLTQYSQSLWREMAAVLPVECEYEQAGTLWVAADEEEMHEVLRKHALYDGRGVETAVLDAATLEQMEPGLRKGLAGALLVPSDAVVYAPAVARALIELAAANGTIIVRDMALQIGEGSVRLRSGEMLKAQRIVNAAGERAAELTPRLPIKRRKGHLAITDRYPGLITHQIVELGYLKSAHSIQADSVAFNVQPRRTGQVLIGSSRQYDAETSGVDQGILSKMLDRAAWYIPTLADTSVLRVWTGSRAATPDKLPLIGPWPGDETVFVAAGHEGLGITTSLATAELLAASMGVREAAIPVDPYLPSRYPASPLGCGEFHV